MIALDRAQATDDATVFSYLRVAFEFTYDVVLFATIVVASAGWGLLNVELSRADVAKAVVSVSIFVSASYVQYYVSLDVTQLIVLVVELAAGIWIWYMLHENSASAQNAVKAHLLAIRNDGIVPASTPIYEKFRIYQVFLNLAVIAFLSFLLLNIVLVILHAENWVVALTNNVIQFGVVVSLMVLFRPRGRSIDEYLQPDGELEGAPRAEVAVEDLAGFEVESAPDGMREWEEGMDLPLQPLVVSSRAQPGDRAERA
jgi:hypothetical protein